MSVPSNREYHYKNLRDRYTNCTYVDGNLEITWIQNTSYDLSFLQHIREVTGYVLISHVDIPQVILPRLQIIRGRTTFKLNKWEDEFGLFVSFSQMNTLEMPALRDILSGSAGIFNNYNLCHVKTINWDEVLSGMYLALSDDSITFTKDLSLERLEALLKTPEMLLKHPDMLCKT